MGASQAKLDKAKRAREVLLKEPWLDSRSIASRFGIAQSSARQIIREVHAVLHIEKHKKTEYSKLGSEHPWRRKARIFGNIKTNVES